MPGGVTPENQSREIELMYDREHKLFSDNREGSFAWHYIERPAFDRFLGDLEHPNSGGLYSSDTRVLDVGCGSGILIRHLVSQGVLPENVVGIDLSEGMINEAKERSPGVKFTKSSAEDFELPTASVDLVVSNMVFHYLDNEQLAQSLELIYTALSEDGVLFFIDADPDYNEVSRDSKNVNKWLHFPTPWGGTAPWYSRDLLGLLGSTAKLAGFDLEAYSQLPVHESGENNDPEQYAKYTSYPARVAVLLKKVGPQKKQQRIDES